MAKFWMVGIFDKQAGEEPKRVMLRFLDILAPMFTNANFEGPIVSFLIMPSIIPKESSNYSFGSNRSSYRSKTHEYQAVCRIDFTEWSFSNQEKKVNLMGNCIVLALKSAKKAIMPMRDIELTQSLVSTAICEICAK